MSERLDKRRRGASRRGCGRKGKQMYYFSEESEIHCFLAQLQQFIAKLREKAMSRHTPIYTGRNFY